MIHNCIVNPLFDSGATHSFMSYDCVKKLGLKVSTLPFELFVFIPMGGKVTTSRVCLKCVVQLGNRYTTLDLVYFPMRDFELRSVIISNKKFANNLKLNFSITKE